MSRVVIMDSEKLRISREKLTRIFRYLEALNQHRNPAKRRINEQPWSFWLRDLPEHASIQRGVAKVVSSKAKRADSQNAEENGSSFVLKVQRPKLTRGPEPPDEIAEWLKDEWDDPAKPAAFEETLEELENSSTPRAVKFTDDPARVQSFERWKLQRETWAKIEKPAREAMKIFEALYTLYGRIEREGERVELILGDGILSWRREEGGVYHPILLQRLQLQFDASVPEFTLSEADHPVELYSALFQSMNDVDGRAIGGCREELEEGGFHPLLNGATSAFLKRLVVQLSPRGEFLEERAPSGEGYDPAIGRDPLLFLRARNLGFAAAIEGILADLRTREDLPWSLLNIVGEELPILEAEQDELQAGDSLRSETEVLLSKPANPEQIRIAQQLEEHGGVLVQGPPGTGKTHTIGNLVGHLLAQGKSVLVTSHTTKALRMVRHHIVPELRPLCVSVLESDLDSRKQLESAVGSIAERLSRADASSLEMEARRLDTERLDLLKKLDEIRAQLAEGRADEYRDIVIAGKTWSPADAARQIVQDKETRGWIPGPVAAVAPLPLSHGELADLYRTSVSITREDETELSGHLPELHDLPRAEEFEASVSERNRVSMEDLDLRFDLWESNAPCTPEQMESLAAALTQAVDPLSGKDKWKLAAVYAGRYGDVHRQPWDQLISLVRLVHREAANAQEAFVKHGPETSGNTPAKDQEHIAAEILAHLENRGKLGSITLFTHKSWSQFLDATKINSARPRLSEHFQTLRQFFRLQGLREDLGARWDRQVATLGAPQAKEMREEIEKTLMQYCDAIEGCLSWQERIWLPLQQRLEDIGFRWQKFLAEQPAVVGPDGELARIYNAVNEALLPILDSRYKKLKLLQLEGDFRELKSKLKLAARVARASKVISQLLSAVSDESCYEYREAYDRLLELKSKQADLDLRRSLLAKLETAAPAWAGAIRNRTGVHGRGEPPRDATSAWVWRQTQRRTRPPRWRFARKPASKKRKTARAAPPRNSRTD